MNHEKKYVCFVSDVCDSNPCLHDGMCIANYVNDSYICVCELSYTGTNCETELIKDENDTGICDCKNDGICLGDSEVNI